MKLQIDRPHVEALLREFPRLEVLRGQLRFGSTAEISFQQLERDELKYLAALYRQGGPELQVRAAQLDTLQGALRGDGPRFAAQDLEQVVPAFANHLLDGATRGWLFSASVTSRALPYVVTRVDYTPASNEEIGKVLIELKANARGNLVSLTVRITSSDIADKTIAEVLAAKGFLKETAALIGAYDVSRCIAMIKYHPPDAGARLRIWQVMLAQFELHVDAALAAQLVELFPDATGRDIKGLAKLVAKYCRQKNVAPALAVFKRCSIFRGMEQLSLSAG